MDPDNNILHQIRSWPLGEAPSEFRELFPEGSDDDWVVYVANSDLLPLAEHSLLRWRRVFPVEVATHPGGGRVYWGAETLGLGSLVESGKPFLGEPPSGKERRLAPRRSFELESRYTAGIPQQVGLGHTIDMSRLGISFTTESWLPANGDVILEVQWPVRLEDDLPVVLRAVGRLVRAEPMKAVLQLGKATFSIAG
jgi:hypothetical protein